MWPASTCWTMHLVRQVVASVRCAAVGRLWRICHELTQRETRRRLACATFLFHPPDSMASHRAAALERQAALGITDASPLSVGAVSALVTEFRARYPGSSFSVRGGGTEISGEGSSRDTSVTLLVHWVSHVPAALRPKPHESLPRAHEALAAPVFTAALALSLDTSDSDDGEDAASPESDEAIVDPSWIAITSPFEPAGPWQTSESAVFRHMTTQVRGGLEHFRAATGEGQFSVASFRAFVGWLSAYRNTFYDSCTACGAQLAAEGTGRGMLPPLVRDYTSGLATHMVCSSRP